MSTAPALDSSSEEIPVGESTIALQSMSLTPMPSDFFSCSPTEIRSEIYRMCDALTLYLNWGNASIYMGSYARKPTPLDVWIATLESDCPVDIKDLPLNDRGWGQPCLPDASVLCRFIRSKTMLQKIYDSQPFVPSDGFYDLHRFPPSPRNAVHAAMRNCWFDMIDIWDDLSDNDNDKFAVYGSHWGYFQHLVTLRPVLAFRSDQFFDHAAVNGELELLKRLPESITGTTCAMNWAAEKGLLDVVKWLHENRTKGCTHRAMDSAAMNGHLDVVKWLHINRTEGCSKDAIESAAYYGHLEVVKWLHFNRSEGCGKWAMVRAACNGHLDVVKWLHSNRTEGCTSNAMDAAAQNGYLDIVKWLHYNRSEGCTVNAMDSAARNGHLDIVKWLHRNRTEGCTDFALQLAAGSGHLEVVQFLHANRTEGDIFKALSVAGRRDHSDIVTYLKGFLDPKYPLKLAMFNSGM